MVSEQLPTKTVVEKVRKVFDANQWGFIDIKLGNDWRLSTNKPAVAEQARAYEGKVAALDYYTRTREKNGKVYENHYLLAVRQPAQDEMPTPLENTVQDELARVGAQRVGTFPNVDTTRVEFNPRSEFQRSKEEMRWTEAVKIATIHCAGKEGADILQLARGIYASLAAGPPPEPDNDIPF